MPSIKHTLGLSFDLALGLVFWMSASGMSLIRRSNLTLNWPCTFLVGVVPYMSNLLTKKEDLPVFVFDVPLHIELQVLLLPFQ